MAKKCHICGKKIKGEQVNCPNCESDLVNLEEEIIRADLVTCRWKNDSVGGSAILTNKRMLFINDGVKQSTPLLFGVLGVLVSMALNSDKHPILFQIPKGDLQRVEVRVSGVLKYQTISLFTTYGNEYTLIPKKKDLASIKEAYELYI